MANLFNTTPNYQYSSSSPFQDQPDEISLFLHQILLHSPPSLQMVPDHAQIRVTPGLNPTSDGNASSSSNGNLENELDNYDCDSEEAIEALVEETTAAAAKPTPSSLRSCSKRSRAAGVHNLSEKRRRSRINEKMKALQNLIPNSNKTDKASMLDEAIEYLKQLQLQVQMLTMRNGLSLYPISLPGMLQPNQTSQTRVDINDPDKFVNMNMTKPICMDQSISVPVTDFLRMVGSKTSFDVESSIQQHHFGAFQIGPSKGICEEKVLPCRPLIKNHHQSSSSGAKAASSIPCESQTTNLKGNVCESGGDHLLANFVNSTIFPSPLNM